MYTLYQLHRHRILGWSLLRWLLSLLILYALLAAAHLAPGRVAGSGAALGMALLTTGGFLWARRRLFVRFRPRDSPLHNKDAYHAPAVGERVPLYVTGLLSVGGKQQIVVHAPGHLEHFRSGERAISALVRPSRHFGVATLPASCEGMWYAFIPSNSVEGVEVGDLKVRGKVWPALRVRFRDEQGARTLYLAFSLARERARAYALLEPVGE